MKKILYLGKNDSYITTLSDQLEGHFLLERFDQRGEVGGAFKKILDSSPSLIIVNFPESFTKLMKLVNLIRSNHKFAKIPLICLTEEKDKHNLDVVSLVGGVIYFFKSVDQDDIVYAIKTLLEPTLIAHQKNARAYFNEKAQVSDIIRIRSVSAFFSQIESNRLFKEGEELKVNFPFFSNFFRQWKHRISSVSSSDIQAPFKYSYSLDYQFNYDQLRPEERTKLLTELKYKFEELPIKEGTFELIQMFNKKPKKISLVSDKEDDLASHYNTQHVAASIKALESSSKALIFNWVFEQAKDKPLTNDSITIYHQAYGLLKSGVPFLDREQTVVMMRESILAPKEEILRDKPSVIAIRVDEVNSLEKVSELVQATTLLRDYFPFFILFNFSTPKIEEVRSKLQYHFVITTVADVSEGLILKMLELYRKKKREKELKRIYKFFHTMGMRGVELGIISENLFYDYKAYRKVEDKENYMYLGLPIEVKSLSEFEVVFTSDQELQIGEVFLMEIPIRFHILIVPHIQDSKESQQKKIYRGLIHFISEQDKKMLRRFVNYVATISATYDKPLQHSDVVKIKGQFFYLDRKS